MKLENREPEHYISAVESLQQIRYYMIGLYVLHFGNVQTYKRNLCSEFHRAVELGTMPCVMS